MSRKRKKPRASRRRHRNGATGTDSRTATRHQNARLQRATPGAWLARLGALVLIAVACNVARLPLYTQEGVPSHRDRPTFDGSSRFSGFPSDDAAYRSPEFSESTARHRLSTRGNPLRGLGSRQDGTMDRSRFRRPVERRVVTRYRTARRPPVRGSDDRTSTPDRLQSGPRGEPVAAIAGGRARPRAAAARGDLGVGDSSRQDSRRTQGRSEARTLPPARAERQLEPADEQEDGSGADDVIVVDVPPSAFERQLVEYVDPEVDAEITQFGYDVFSRAQTPPTDVPVGDDYVLGTGDHIVVSIWGNLDIDFEGTIGRDGQVRIPQIGPIALKGHTLQSAERILRRAFDRWQVDYELQVSLGRLRDMPVHVIGRVSLPGRQRVSSIATLFDALTAAGGVTKDGTLRSIIVRREGAEDRSVDLYDYLLEGRVDVDVSLAANDVIVVPAVGPRVAIVGRVLRPAVYEFLDAPGPSRETGEAPDMKTLLTMAGGFARLADRHEIQIESAASAGASLRAVDLDRSSAADMALSDGDVVIVREASPRLDNVVYLGGNVTQPGRYPFRPGMRVSDLVTPDRLVEAGFWLDRLAPGDVDSSLELPEPYLDYAIIRRIDPQTQTERRIPFSLESALFANDASENHALQPQDTILVFPREAFEPPRPVHISGAVGLPGHVEWFEGMRARDLIRMAGGLLPEAHLASAVLTRVHPDQDGARTEILHLDLREVLRGDPASNIPLEREDALMVRPVPGYRKPFQVELEGEVKQPGSYWMIPGERLSDLIARAGGFTDDAYLPAARFYKQSVRELQRERLEDSLQRLELEAKLATQRFTADAAVIEKQGGSKGEEMRAESERIERLIETIRSTPPKGRMVVELRPAEELENTEGDIELEAGDRLVVPRRPQEVNVIGAVFNQTALRHRDGATVEEYLAACGGPSESAAAEMLFIIRADGSSDSLQSYDRGFHWDSKRGRFSTGGLLKSELRPGDTVVVPYDVKPKLSKLGLTSTVSQILFQAAMATGVVIALL